MEEVTSAEQLIDLAKKVEPFELQVLNLKVFYKRMNPSEAIAYLHADDSFENLLYYTLCKSDGEKLFKDKEQAKEFSENMPIQSKSKLLRKINEFNFPPIETMAGNS